MKKIPTIFVRDFTKRPHLVTTEVTVGCEWVFAGEGTPTRKWDGTCVLIRDGKMYARYDCKKGRTPPEGFEPCEPEPDTETGHWPGWVLVEEQSQYKWHRKVDRDGIDDGTYELIGPKVNGNPDCSKEHILVKHGIPSLIIDDRSFSKLKKYLTEDFMVEGIVFHHSDGRMAKIKRKDFGLQWPVKKEERA